MLTCAKMDLGAAVAFAFGNVEVATKSGASSLEAAVFPA